MVPIDKQGQRPEGDKEKMGYYYNPPDKLNRTWVPNWWPFKWPAKERGRRIHGSAWFSLKWQLRDGEVLFGVYDNGLWRAAAWIFDKGEFTAHEESYAAGNAISRQFYAIPKEAVRKGMDHPDCFDDEEESRIPAIRREEAATQAMVEKGDTHA